VLKLQSETDNQELVRLWASGQFQRSYLAPILREIRDISAGFHDFSLMYANRVCNQVARVLSKQVTDVDRLGVWHEALVGFIVGLAHNTFNKSINSMVHNIMWYMICIVWEFD
jgi:hypothetical protein